MKQKGFASRLLSLLLVVLMLAGAAIAVNKSLFGHPVGDSVMRSGETVASVDTIRSLPDGTTVVNTTGIPGTTDGYAGPVPLEIYIRDGKVTDIQSLPNGETPSFFGHASSLFSEWKGKTPEETAKLKVDAVSGATFSSNAIISNVNAGLGYYLGHQGKSHTTVPVKIWIALAVTLAACIIPLFVKNKIYHNVQMAANVIVLGFWCGQFLDYTLILKYMSTGLTWPVGILAAVMLIAAFIYPLFGRPQHYCNHICPLGSAQQLAGSITKHKIHLTPGVMNGLDWFRKILWAVLMLMLWTDCLTEWMDLELFQAFQFESASWWIIGTAILFVVLSVFISRPYCRFVCPTGSLFKRAENIG